jgi:hypothetical protein
MESESAYQKGIREKKEIAGLFRVRKRKSDFLDLEWNNEPAL